MGGRVNPGAANLLHRAKKTMEAARVLRDGGLSPDACDRAWWAAVFAARAALAVKGKEAVEPAGMLRSFREAHPKLAAPHLEDIGRLDVLKESADWDADPGLVPGDVHAREAVEAAGAIVRDVESFLEERGLL